MGSFILFHSPSPSPLPRLTVSVVISGDEILWIHLGGRTQLQNTCNFAGGKKEDVLYLGCKGKEKVNS